MTIDFVSIGPNVKVDISTLHFASFLSGGFTTMAVIKPPEKKLAKRTSVHWLNMLLHCQY